MQLNNYDWSNVNFVDIFSVKGSSAGTKFYERGRCDIYQIGIKTIGESEILYNNKKYCFNAGNVLYLPKENTPDIDYRTTIVEQGISICIFFDSPNGLPKEPILISQVPQRLKDLFLQLCNAYNMQNRDIFHCRGLFFEILSQMSNKLNVSVKSNDMADVILYMQNHVADKYISFNEFADKNNMSIDRFRHKFKEIYNISPLQYFNILKINYIKKLIRNPNYSILDIAVLSGFDDFNYFCRFFKKHTGYSAGEYRKMIKGGICV